MHKIETELDVAVPMRDGTILRADVHRPSGRGPFPVLLCRGPYGKTVTTDTSLTTSELVRAGYIVVHQDTRGRFLSDGEWLAWEYERNDGYDTVEWAATLPGSNGKVGTFGGSYLGSTQWSSAIAGAPSLKAVAPAITWNRPEDGIFFRGGAIEHGLNVYWSLLMAAAGVAKSDGPLERVMQTVNGIDEIAEHTYWQLPSGAHPAVAECGIPGLGVERALNDPKSMAQLDVSAHADKVSVPSLSLAGWYDIFLQGSLDNYRAMRNRGLTARLVVGPWHHSSYNNGWAGGQVGEVNFGLGAGTVNGQTISQVQREWYDHWLQGEPATEAHESGVLIFVMGANQWRPEPDWPLLRAVDTPLHLEAGGNLIWDQPSDDGSESGFFYDPANPVIMRGGNVAMSTDYPAGPYDQRDVEARDDVLVFTTEALEQDTEITGRVRATLFVSTDGPSTDWVVRLCEVDERGTSRNIVDGVTRVQTVSGGIDEIDVDLWSTSILIRAGRRLRVHVTSSNFPRWDRNLNTGEPVTEGTAMRVAANRVYHDSAHPSRIVLPLVPE